jgi:hypothetical protein
VYIRAKCKILKVSDSKKALWGRKAESHTHLVLNTEVYPNNEELSFHEPRNSFHLYLTVT